MSAVGIDPGPGPAKRRYRHMTDLDVEHVRTMLANGKSQGEAAALAGFSQSAVHRRFGRKSRQTAATPVVVVPLDPAHMDTLTALAKRQGYPDVTCMVAHVIRDVVEDDLFEEGQRA